MRYLQNRQLPYGVVLAAVVVLVSHARGELYLEWNWVTFPEIIEESRVALRDVMS